MSGENGGGTAAADQAGEQSPPIQPFLRIVRGQPDDAEISALTVALAAVAAVSGGDRSEPTDRTTGHQWGQPARTLREPLAPSGWWASGLPR